MQHNIKLYILVTAMLFGLSPLAIDMYLPALPSMAKAMSVSINDMEMSVAVFLLAFALAQPVFGMLADRFHKLNLLLSGLVIFTLSSMAVPLVETIEGLYLARIFQAIGGASSVVCFAMIQQKFDVQKGSHVITYVMASVVIAPLIAPMIGGQILKNGRWEEIFYVLAGIGILAFVLSLFTHSEKLEVVNHPIDNHDVDSHNMVNEAVDKVDRGASLADFIAIFKQPLPIGFIFLGGFGFAALFSFVAGSAFVYIDFFRISPENYSYLLGLNALAMIFGSLLSAKVLANISPNKKAIIAGLLLGPLSFLFFVLANMQAPLTAIVISVFMFNILLGMISANAIAAAMSFFPTQGGAISGVFGLCQFALGAAFSGAISLSHAQSPAVLLSFMGLACASAAMCSTYLYTRS
ncbi:Bcr/CflA family efflux MFS transporter [Shewanella sp. D64]|uniref:Bcr/CflA family efflux MFS transporter n=1 Tax=unclassified Shewanella TaxID=196818 RepID=UPI0022BA1D6B|nr:MULTISPECIES: Bcr/CflA family efflux MFS transporter [unclassified Shewanella]MEC4725121.1 Bcr/CflA family efflux MFS transporter [Shewanella sp. D64]MEC4737022.1 Bcr/CflA family efflux MFS transporter [Shewanella sp. E94]WBJ96610.1 Bcr/CflA family efflux MFS transporter [Shewanella sp. MTB7]